MKRRHAKDVLDFDLEPKIVSPTLGLADDSYGDVVRYWILRIMVTMGSHKNMLYPQSVRDDEVFVAVGLGWICEKEREGEYDYKLALKGVSELHDEISRTSIRVPSSRPLECNLNWLAERLGLSQVDLEILRFVVLADDCDYLETVLNRMSSHSLQTIQRMFSLVLGLPAEDVALALRPDGKLATCGLVTVDLGYSGGFTGKIELLKRLPDQLFNEHADPMHMLRERVVPGLEAKLKVANYHHVDADYTLIRRYLEASQGKAGVNILIYGPPGTGKTEFVRMISCEMKRPLYEVATQENDATPLAGHQRLQAFRLAQNMLCNEKEAIVLFDEIEDAFSQDEDDKPSRTRSSAGKKAWINQMLESNPIPSFWLSNSVRVIDKAILRRFDYVLRLDYPKQSVRSEIIQGYFKQFGVSDAWVEQIAGCDHLAPAIVERAAKVVACLGPEIPAEEAATRIMSGTLGAMSFSPIRKRSAKSGMNYRADCINTDPSIEALAERLAIANQGRLFFYGPPGTGKTAFGRYLAERLEKRLIVKRASDILSPWVGVAEKQMAEMFSEANDDEAILLLDEADSFLQDRGRANQSWEISQVNEMLTQMETFEGIFIASTNFMESLDSATLRRFDLKVRFDWLKPDQIALLLGDLIQSMQLDSSPEAIEAITRIDCLTPGDFANIHRQSMLRPFQCIQEVQCALIAEVNAKPQGRLLGRIGF